MARKSKADAAAIEAPEAPPQAPPEAAQQPKSRCCRRHKTTKTAADETPRGRKAKRAARKLLREAKRTRKEAKHQSKSIRKEAKAKAAELKHKAKLLLKHR